MNTNEIIEIHEIYWNPMNEKWNRPWNLLNIFPSATIITHAIDACKEAFDQKLRTDTDYEDTIFCGHEPDFCKRNVGAPAQKTIGNGQKSTAVLHSMPSLGLSICLIGFYTNVAYHKDLIMNNMEIWR